MRLIESFFIFIFEIDFERLYYINCDLKSKKFSLNSLHIISYLLYYHFFQIAFTIATYADGTGLSDQKILAKVIC